MTETSTVHVPGRGASKAGGPSPSPRMTAPAGPVAAAGTERARHDPMPIAGSSTTASGSPTRHADRRAGQPGRVRAAVCPGVGAELTDDGVAALGRERCRRRRRRDGDGRSGRPAPATRLARPTPRRPGSRSTPRPGSTRLSWPSPDARRRAAAARGQQQDEERDGDDPSRPGASRAWRSPRGSSTGGQRARAGTGRDVHEQDGTVVAVRGPRRSGSRTRRGTPCPIAA